MVAISPAITVHLALILYSMCHRPVLCTGRQNTYPVSSVMKRKKKDKSTFATGGLILSCQIALIANILKSEHMLVY